MLFEIFIKSTLLPSLILMVGVFLAGYFSEWIKDWLQGLCFVAGMTYSIYLIRGGMGRVELGGVESVALFPAIFFIGLILMALPLIRQVAKLLVVLASVMILLRPLVQDFSLQFVNLENPTFRVSAAFFLLTLSLWSFSERQFANGYWISQGVSATVAWSAASLFFLFKNSASLSQYFGVFACVGGLLVGLALILKWQISARAASGFLVALPLVFLSAGALYANVTPLTTMALALPFLVSAVRPQMAFQSRFKEAFIVAFLSALSVAWFVFQAYRS